MKYLELNRSRVYFSLNSTMQVVNCGSSRVRILEQSSGTKTLVNKAQTLTVPYVSPALFLNIKRYYSMSSANCKTRFYLPVLMHIASLPLGFFRSSKTLHYKLFVIYVKVGNEWFILSNNFGVFLITYKNKKSFFLHI